MIAERREIREESFQKCEDSDNEVEFHKPTKILDEMKSKESLR